MLSDEQFDHKWEEIKGALRNLWRDLTDDEIDNVRNNIYEIGQIVEERYGEPKRDIKIKIDRLLESFNNDTDKNLDPDVTSYHRRPST